jgi:hypothetical protein
VLKAIIEATARSGSVPFRSALRPAKMRTPITTALPNASIPPARPSSMPEWVAADTKNAARVVAAADPSAAARPSITSGR